MPSKRRAAPDPVDPVVHDGIRYEVVHFGRALGLKQNGGYLQKLDTESGEDLGFIRIYKVRYRWWRAMQKDKQDVFITNLMLDEARSRLLIDSEQDGHYAYDIESGEVETVESVQLRSV